jgi:hypothetical protein
MLVCIYAARQPLCPAWRLHCLDVSASLLQPREQGCSKVPMIDMRRTDTDTQLSLICKRLQRGAPLKSNSPLFEFSLSLLLHQLNAARSALNHNP